MSVDGMFINSEIWSAKRLGRRQRWLVEGRTDPYPWFVIVPAYLLVFTLSGLLFWMTQYVHDGFAIIALNLCAAVAPCTVVYWTGLPEQRIKYRRKLIQKGELLVAEADSAAKMVLIDKVYERWQRSELDRQQVNWALMSFAIATLDLPRFWQDNVSYFDVLGDGFWRWGAFASFNPYSPLGALGMYCDCESELAERVNAVLGRDCYIRKSELYLKRTALFEEQEPHIQVVDRIDNELEEIDWQLRQVPARLTPTQHA